MTTVILPELRDVLCTVHRDEIAGAWFCNATADMPLVLSGKPNDAKSYTDHDIQFCAVFNSYRDEFQSPHLAESIKNIRHICDVAPPPPGRWDWAKKLGVVSAIVGLATFVYQTGRWGWNRWVASRTAAAELPARAAAPLLLVPHRDVVYRQLDQLATNRNKLLREAGVRFRQLSHEPDGSIVQAYVVERAIRHWLGLTESEQRRWLKQDRAMLDGAVPRGFLDEFALRVMGRDGPPAAVLGAAALVWANGNGEHPRASRLPTPIPVSQSATLDIVPDPRVVRAQLDDLVNSRDARLKAGGTRFHHLDAVSQDYLVELAIHHWYYRPDRNAPQAADHAAILREAIPKSFIKWFAFTYLATDEMVPSIRAAAANWQAHRVPLTRRARDGPAAPNEFQPQLDTVRLQVARLPTMSQLHDVQTYIARIALERWYSLPLSERTPYIDASDEPARGILPYRFLLPIAERWRELEADIIEHAVVHARLLELFPEWQRVRFHVTHERAMQIWEALDHVPGFGRTWLIDPQNREVLCQLITPFGMIGNGARSKAEADALPWTPAVEPTAAVDYRGYSLPRVMEALATEHPELRHYHAILAERAMTLIGDWEGAGATVHQLFAAAEVRDRTDGSEQHIPVNYVAFWHHASPAIGSAARDATPLERDPERGETNIGLITGADVLLGAGEVGVRLGVGGIPFIVGEYFSNVITGRSEPTLGDVAQSYSALATGGSAGQLGVDTFFSATDTLSHTFARHTIPLFTAILLHDVVRHHHVDWETMPVEIANIVVASGATTALGTLVTEGEIVPLIAEALHCSETFSALATPETLGTSLVVTSLSAAFEFTLLKKMGAWEDEQVINHLGDQLRAELADALSINNQLMAEARMGNVVQFATLIRAERRLLRAEQCYARYLEQRVGLLDAAWQEGRRAIDEHESELLGRPLDGSHSRHDIRVAMDHERDDLDHEYQKKIAALETGTDQATPRLLIDNPPSTLSTWQRWSLLPARLFVSTAIQRGAAAGTSIINMRSKLEERIATNLQDLAMQQDDYHERRNAFWTSVLEQQLRRRVAMVKSQPLFEGRDDAVGRGPTFLN